MYTEHTLRELEQIYEDFKKLVESHKDQKAMAIASKIYGYEWVPDEVYINESGWHPGTNLVNKYGFDKSEKTYADALIKTAKQIQKDTHEKNFRMMEYFDFVIIPEFTWNGQTIKNAVFDLVAFNHYARQGSTETPRGVTFQLHSPSNVKDTYNNFYANSESGINANAAKSIEKALGITLCENQIYMGENLNNAWTTLKLMIPDEREICHPVMTYTENQDSTCWPRAVYQYAPQYRRKECDYMLFNYVYDTEVSKRIKHAIMTKEGLIKASSNMTTLYGLPLEFTIGEAS